MDNQARIDFLSQLIQIDTAGGFEDRVATVLQSFMKQHDISCRLLPVMPGRSNFYAQLGTGKNGKVLAFCGHQDVVKTEDPAMWHFPPFSAHIENGRMYGRGTADMKGGLAAMAIALAELKDAGVTLNGKLELLGTVAEESSKINHMQGAQQFAKDGYVDNITAAIFAEPTNADIAYAHKGSITYRIDSIGKAAHSSRPDLGFNAITPLIHFYQEQERYFGELVAKYENPVLGRAVPVVTKIDGGEQLNAVPDHAELFVKLRTIPETDNDEIIAHLSRIIANINDQDHAQLSIEVLGSKIAVTTERNAEIVAIAQKAATDHLGHSFNVRGIAFGTDASEMTKANRHMDVLVFGPGNATAHKIDEYIDLDQYLSMIDIYKQIARDYLK
ncbi:MAG: ArgE/DapE family deacylase [Limosilactobacillus mucosae]